MLKLKVSSGGRVTGQLELPMPLDEMKRQLDTIRTQYQVRGALGIHTVDCAVPSISWHLSHTILGNDSTLQKLNQLAEVIDNLNAAGLYHLSKSLNPEIQQSLNDVLRIASHVKPCSMNCYEVIPGVTTEQELGKWLVEHDRLEDKVPETLRSYLDYRSIGIDYRNEHEGEFLTGGYTGIRTGAIGQVLEEQSALQLTLTTADWWYYLRLPASEEEMTQAKHDLEVEDFDQANIAAVKFSAPQLNSLIPPDGVTVEDANKLALCLKEMELEDGEEMKFCAVLEAEQPETFTEALNIAMNRDDYELVPENAEEYGKQVLRRIGADDEIINTIDGYMDFAQLGTDSLAEDGIHRTEFGLVRRLSMPFPPEPEIGQAML